MCYGIALFRVFGFMKGKLMMFAHTQSQTYAAQCEVGYHPGACRTTAEPFAPGIQIRAAGVILHLYISARSHSSIAARYIKSKLNF